MDNLKKAADLYMRQYLLLTKGFYVNGAGLQDIHETGYAEMYHYRPIQKCDFTCTEAIYVIFQFNGLED